MRLHDFLETVPDPRGRKWTQQSFGVAVNAQQQAVSRWADGQAIPRRHAMAAIKRVTGGRVQEADFYAQAALYARTKAKEAAEAGGGKQAPENT